MNREELLKNICPANPIEKYDICTKSKCDRCNIMLNEMLDEYDILIKADAIDEFVGLINSMPTYTDENGVLMPMPVEMMAQKMKGEI